MLHVQLLLSTYDACFSHCMDINCYGIDKCWGSRMVVVHKKYSESHDVVFANKDCLQLLKDIPNDCIDLTITSPPYCMGKSYEASKSCDDFRKAHLEILPEIVRVTKKGGSICWQVGYHINSGVTTPLDLIVHSIMSEIGNVCLRNRIIWSFGHGLHCSSRFSGRHEVVMWYTKGDDYYFDLDAVRIPQKYPGKTHYKGDKRGEPSANPKGKNPGNVWDIPVVNANHVEKTEHPCQFPVALAQRLVLALSKKGDRVFDPFSGVATTGCAAIIEGRKFCGAELSKNYYALGFRRLHQAGKGILKFRSHEIPVSSPNPKSKVAQNPFTEE